MSDKQRVRVTLEFFDEDSKSWKMKTQFEGFEFRSQGSRNLDPDGFFLNSSSLSIQMKLGEDTLYQYQTKTKSLHD